MKTKAEETVGYAVAKFLIMLVLAVLRVVALIVSTGLVLAVGTAVAHLMLRIVLWAWSIS